MSITATSGYRTNTLEKTNDSLQATNVHEDDFMVALRQQSSTNDQKTTQWASIVAGGAFGLAATALTKTNPILLSMGAVLGAVGGNMGAKAHDNDNVLPTVLINAPGVGAIASSIGGTALYSLAKPSLKMSNVVTGFAIHGGMATLAGAAAGVITAFLLD